MNIYPDEEYVAQILAFIPSGLTKEQFNEYCQKDLNAGYAYEVAAARIEYFKDQKQ